MTVFGGMDLTKEVRGLLDEYDRDNPTRSLRPLARILLEIARRIEVLERERDTIHYETIPDFH